MTCGFALVVDAEDPRPFEQINEENHVNELRGVEDKSSCPACHGYLKKYGGRREGVVEMPDIVEAGTLVEEDEEIATKVLEMNRDFVALADARGDGDLTNLRRKYRNKKIFAYSVDDLVARFDRQEARKNKEK